MPWELLRDPVTDGVLALRAGAFVRTHPESPVTVRVPEQGPGGLRVLLVICRPGGREDVPFRSVASHLVRLSREAREAFRLDVLRPPAFAELARALEAAKDAGEPYQVVHFDGPDGSPPADHATRAWITATSELGRYYNRQYYQGHTGVTGVLGVEEANLLQARRLALTHGWHDLAIGPMQGLTVLYGHTGRAIEWRRLVAELVPEFTDPATGAPRPGREEYWAVLTNYRVRIARDARDWPAAEQLQGALITWVRGRAAAALAIPPGELGDQQRTQIRNLAATVGDLGQILREQDDSGCVQPFLEAMELYQRVGDRRPEATAAFDLGKAYMDVSSLYDLGQAEQWYQRYLELLQEDDTLGRARGTGQLGQIAYQRFKDAQATGTSDEQLLRHLNDAADAYHQALALLPDNAVDELAAIHRALGTIYGETDDTATALGHYQKAIQYRDRQDNRYGAGLARYAAALTLADVGRRYDALLYARAALRDVDAVGPGAGALTDQVRQLITALEQQPPDDHDDDAGDAT